MYIIPNINKKDIKRIVFFDVDQTLTSSVLHSIIPVNEALRNKAKFEADGFKVIHSIDAQSLNPIAVQLFAELFKVPGTYAVCISSWGWKNQDSINEIDRLFRRFADFPQDWLIGTTSGVGGDRYTHDILPFMEANQLDAKIVALDDRAREYAENNIAVEIDGTHGLNIYDFAAACNILGIEELEHNADLNHFLQNLRHR